MIVVLAAGCQKAGKPSADAPTRIDRLMRHYPELAGGRFVVLADFEEAQQLEIFDYLRTSPAADMQWDPNGGRPETGAAGLRTWFASPADTLRINNDRARQWHLKRDWREYDLLMLSVFVPTPRPRDPPRTPSPLELTLHAGPVHDMRAVAATLPLQFGWNTLRLDLADAGERIPLDDVRGIEMSLPRAASPEAILLDDLLLTGHRTALHGDPAARDGSLYVQRSGRRIQVGSAGRFELVFGNGQVVAWYDLANDPLRSHNRVDGALIAPRQSDSSQPDASADRWSATTRVLEANPVRAIVECDWFETTPVSAREPDRALRLRWTYTIYAAEQVFVTVQVAGKEDAAPPALIVSMNRGSGDGWRVHSEIVLIAKSESGEQAEATYAFLQDGSSDRELLFVPAPDNFGTLTSSDRAEIRGALVVDPIPDSRSRYAYFYLNLLPPHAEFAADPAAHASAFQHPGGFAVETGRPGDEEGMVNGFDRRTGSYVVEADENGARFTLDARSRPMLTTAVEVRGIGDRTPWVYVNDRLVENIARTNDGNLLLSLPAAGSAKTRVEVLLGKRAEPITTGGRNAR